MTALPLAAEATPHPLRSDLRVAAVAFAATLGVLLAAFAGSAWLLAGSAALWTDAGPVRLARFCGFLSLVTAYLVGAVVLMRRGTSRDFAALRGVTDSTAEGWHAWEQRFASRRGGVLAAGIGAGVGLGVHLLGAALSEREPPTWSGLLWWAALLSMLLFANLARLARWSILEIRALRGIGRRVRVSLLDRSALAPFVRAGLRSSIAWIAGSSLATTLTLDVSEPWLVLSVLVGTMAIAIAALVLPSAGLNERLRAEKQRELGWVLGEIARARKALGGTDPASRDDASRLPALLAWESRVEAASTWPFGAPTLMRFSLLLLVPIGSWLGGALVERAIEALLG